MREKISYPETMEINPFNPEEEIGKMKGLSSRDQKEILSEYKKIEDTLKREDFFNMVNLMDEMGVWTNKNLN